MARPRSGPSFAPGARRHVSSGAAGIAALTVPVLLAIPTVQVILSGDGDELAVPTASLVSGVLFLVAAPTTWLFSLLDASPWVTVLLSLATSLPLWFGVGVWLAGRSQRWRDWTARYLTVALVWAIGFLLLLGAIGTIVG